MRIAVGYLGVLLTIAGLAGLLSAVAVGARGLNRPVSPRQSGFLQVVASVGAFVLGAYLISFGWAE